MRYRFIMLAIGLSATSIAAASQTLRVCHENQDYLPYLRAALTPHTNNKRKQGLFADLLNVSAQRLNIKIEYISAPWKRCILFMRTGKVDALLAALYDKNRESWGVYPRNRGLIDQNRRLWTVHYRLYHHRTSPLTWDGHRLNHNTLGVDAPPGYKTHQRLKEMGALPALSHLPEQGFRMIQRRRLEGYVLEEETAKRLIKRQGFDQIVPATKVFLAENLFLPFSHHWFAENTQLAEQLWSTLAAQRDAQQEPLAKTYQISAH